MVLADQRRSRLLEFIRTTGFATLPDLAEQLQVSESTIRRDLSHLEQQGSAQRTHGGVLYTGESPKSHHFDKIQARNWNKKKSIALAASRAINDGETILLDGGSTTYELARLLVGRSLQIVTNSLPVANLFSANDASDLIVLGGYIHTRTGVSLGPYAVDMLEHLNCDRAYLSIAGADETGFYNSNLLLVETERAMMNAASHVSIVADSTKFDRKSLAHLCPLNAVDTVISDDSLPDKWRAAIRNNSVQMVFGSSVSEPHSEVRA